MRLEHASHPVPTGAATTVVHVPRGLGRDGPLQLVVFLHGWRGCAPALVERGETRCRPQGEPRRGWGLGHAHDRAQSDSVLVVPQLSWLARDGSAGRFAEAGFARAWLEELLGEVLGPKLGAERTPDDVESIHLVAHSAGYETALAILEQGQLDETIRSVVLLDALYAGAPRFARWVADDPERQLVSLFTGGGGPRRHSRALARRLQRELGRDAVARSMRALTPALGSQRVLVARSPHPHGALPARHMAEVVAALGLRARLQ